MLNAATQANFFENRAAEYSTASASGTREEVFADRSPESGADWPPPIAG
jgi:hypothetical protein